MADALSFEPAKGLIKGLAAVKRRDGVDVHFIHVALSEALCFKVDSETRRQTSGAKIFSVHAGIKQTISDVADDVYAIEKIHEAPYALMRQVRRSLYNS